MRTDAKVGLICGFVLILAVVAYYAFPPGTKPAETGTGGTPSQLTMGTGDKTDKNSSVAIAPPTATAPAPSPDLSKPSGGSALLNGGGGIAGSPSGLSGSSSGAGSVPITGPGAASGPTPPHGLLTSVGSTPTTGPGSGLGGGLGGSLAGGPSGGLAGGPGLTGDLPPAPSGSFGAGPGSSSSGGTLFTPPTSPTLGGGSHGNTVEIDRAPPTTRPSGGRRGNGLLESAGAGTAGSGNVPGLHESAGATFVAPPAPSGSASTYTVVKGDILTTIAKKNHVTLKALKAANPTINPDRLPINAKLKIPAPTAEAPKPAATRPAATRPASGARGATTRTSATTRTAGGGASRTLAPGSSYIIQKGDTLRKIAKAAYGDENMWRRIARSNRADLPNPNQLTAGHVLKLPAR